MSDVVNSHATNIINIICLTFEDFVLMISTNILKIQSCLSVA